jgi:hypothetical protein
MTIGIRGFREPRVCDGLIGMLMIPFSGNVNNYAINRRQWQERD